MGTKDNVALVTGANKGIGYEIARSLGKLGAKVFLGCRDKQRGETAAEALRSESVHVRVICLDVTDRDSIQTAVRQIELEFGRLDILVNNAAVHLEGEAKPSVVELDAVRRVYDVNVFGVIAVTQAMLPLLLKSERGRIVNVSSRLGSLTGASEPGQSMRPLLLGYCSSKAALNAITVQFANELRETPIKVNAACPGYCATDLNGHRGTRTAGQGAMTPVRLATLPLDGPTGAFFNDDGVVAW